MFSKKWKEFFWLKRELEELKDWDWRIIEYIQPRNYEQNKLYWVLLTFVSRESGNDIDDIHEQMKLWFNSTYISVLGSKRKKKIWWSTTKLNKKQFSLYYFNVEKFFAEVGYTMPPFDSQEFHSLYNSVNF